VFQGFVGEWPRAAAEINAALRERGIVGGYDLAADYPELGNAMLVCVTEMNSRAEIDTLVEAMNEER
jgi:glycine dehydrogenase subunit 1